MKLFRKNPGSPAGDVAGKDVSEALFVVLDTETTGLDPLHDRILSIGVLKLQGGRIRVRESMELFIAQEHFDHRSVPIHGILKQGPNRRLPEREALEQFLGFCDGAILVGHHIGFDLEMLRRGLARHGMPEPGNPCLDTDLLYKATLLKSPLLNKKAHYSLDELAGRFDLSCKDRHTALGDAYLTAVAFLHILGLLAAKRPLTLKYLLRIGS
ncbi:3'-5' exonuclease [Robiginitalea marina]|uniref:3'-5' exonuclease n=1 Tax=Robiginitalea marina TaxID=2954105 RepID=A0ABT1AUN3_9FLAO|nr:3'-5' exonuclease [Robiginitalea marina]MCO5723359.1 3'-5' exonuclease [Robiginitalea marina]